MQSSPREVCCCRGKPSEPSIAAGDDGHSGGEGRTSSGRPRSLTLAAPEAVSAVVTAWSRTRYQTAASDEPDSTPGPLDGRQTGRDNTCRHQAASHRPEFKSPLA